MKKFEFLGAVVAVCFAFIIGLGFGHNISNASANQKAREQAPSAPISGGWTDARKGLLWLFDTPDWYLYDTTLKLHCSHEPTVTKEAKSWLIEFKQ